MTSKPKKVLVAPLDWGLGHATRCIPIIKLLLRKGHHVSIASSGDAKRLLFKEFPHLKFHDLPSYGAVYSKYIPFMIYIFLQLPKFLTAIYLEKKAVGRLVKENEIDVIISDNRYGCRVSNVQSMIVCHQINLIMPWWQIWMSPVINNFNHQMISKFDQCWIPDDPKISLAGKLSYPGLPNSTYIGVLSHFVKQEKRDFNYHLAVVLSGPEPQRRIFEEIVMRQLQQVQFKTIVVRGVLDNNEQRVSDYVTVVNHLTANALQKIVEESEIILCRSGYSSIMDLATLGKRAIFVPTPGQTEQEYLGLLSMKKNIAPCYTQKKFNLQQALEEVKSYTGFRGVGSQPNLLEQAIESELK